MTQRQILWNKIATYFMPHICVLCSNISQLNKELCVGCLNDLPQLPPHCKFCAEPISVLTKDKICGACLNKRPALDALHVLYSYDPPISTLITELKFHSQLSNARVLGSLLTTAFPQWYATGSLPELIIPVPLHKKRLQERGFNQALEIARSIQKNIKIPIDYTSCQRIKNTLPQSHLQASDRSHNLKNAFAINHSFAGCHVAVLDDVITTGATLAAFCRELKSAGCKQIDVWCCAKTLSPNVG